MHYETSGSNIIGFLFLFAAAYSDDQCEVRPVVVALGYSDRPAQSTASLTYPGS